eukprot:CAMPEP_0201539520 /NCGR_PEP_ID=MMETSP0161_2-20130828/70446_1 /ASSEMBLY_ACC=CAM_ASM_000251 /TAXON_ID=180227 /ORGANISM="Neoparamoeba aestuarina, Strain SoJaBio B1-5/56/2" /LENGTH=457 /DNA_ID=CAMNT_0047946923 /DNA_START=1429 /DNA_END=2802 /DNA_ORIENTATION=+
MGNRASVERVDGGEEVDLVGGIGQSSDSEWENRSTSAIDPLASSSAPPIPLPSFSSDDLEVTLDDINEEDEACNDNNENPDPNPIHNIPPPNHNNNNNNNRNNNRRNMNVDEEIGDEARGSMERGSMERPSMDRDERRGEPIMLPDILRFAPRSWNPGAKIHRRRVIQCEYNLLKGTVQLLPEENQEGFYKISFEVEATVDCLISVYLGLDSDQLKSVLYPMLKKGEKKGEKKKESGDREEENLPSVSPLWVFHFKAEGGLSQTITTNPIDFSDLISKDDEGEIKPIERIGEWNKVWKEEEENPSSSSPSRSSSPNANPFSKNDDPVAPLLILTSPVDLDNENLTIFGQVTSVGLVPTEGQLSGVVEDSRLIMMNEIYTTHDIYGVDYDGDQQQDMGKDCVICLATPPDTMVLPCRHMCVCRDCGDVFRHQCEKCPICRAPILSLVQIVASGEELKK